MVRRRRARWPVLACAVCLLGAAATAGSAFFSAWGRAMGAGLGGSDVTSEVWRLSRESAEARRAYDEAGRAERRSAAADATLERRLMRAAGALALAAAVFAALALRGRRARSTPAVGGLAPR